MFFSLCRGGALVDYKVTFFFSVRVTFYIKFNHVVIVYVEKEGSSS